MKSLLRAYRDFVILAAISLLVGVILAGLRYEYEVRWWLGWLQCDPCFFPPRNPTEILGYAAVLALATYLILVMIVLTAKALRRQTQD